MERMDLSEIGPKIENMQMFFNRGIGVMENGDTETAIKMFNFSISAMVTLNEYLSRFVEKDTQSSLQNKEIEFIDNSSDEEEHF